MAAVRQADATWSGNLPDGKGTVSAISSGAFNSLPTTWASRIEASDGRTSPEELLAAAHASCFSMAFGNELFKRGFIADRLAVTANVTLDLTDAGRRVISSALTVSGVVPGIDAADLRRDRRGCQERLPDLECDQGQRDPERRADARGVTPA